MLHYQTQEDQFLLEQLQLIFRIIESNVKMRELHNVLNAKCTNKKLNCRRCRKIWSGYDCYHYGCRGQILNYLRSKAAGGLDCRYRTSRFTSCRQTVEGRAGRQGDPGSSQFYVSLEDNLMRLFGSEIAK
jgi:hypothetical protein